VRRAGSLRGSRLHVPITPGSKAIPPLLPVLLPLVLAAIACGILFAWAFPPAAPGGAAPAARFTDITNESGLDQWPLPPRSDDAPTTLGGGVVCFDYDGDGHPDLFFVGGGPWPWEEPFAKRISRGSCALFHNDGAAHFTDVTAAAGLNVELQGMSAAAGDFDNDGLPDLFVTCVGTNHLFRNLGGGHFEDVTDRAGVGGDDNTWSTGTVWIDVDHDGRLDLVVAHYARWPAEVDLLTAFRVSEVGRSYGTPTGFVGAFPSVYRNLGDGRFALVSDSAGLRDIDLQTSFPVAKTLAVTPVDANEDGRLDLLFTYLANESALFLDEGDGHFRRIAAADRRQEGIATGVASTGSLPIGATGRDQRLAALQLITSDTRGRADGWASLYPKLGAALFDYDLDGRLDVLSGNARAEPDTNHFENGRTFEAPPELRWNRGGAWITSPAAEGDSWRQPLWARGIAAADFDGDGDLDVVIAQNGAAPRLLRNDERLGWPWLQLDLVAIHGARDAGGARVEVHTPRRTLVQTVAPAMTLLAQSTQTLTFGLGDDSRVRRIVVYWPNGARQEFKPEGINRRLIIKER
jgi:hypothetical protein